MSNLLLTVKKQDLGVRICDSCVFKIDLFNRVSAFQSFQSFNRFALFKTFQANHIQKGFRGFYLLVSGFKLSSAPRTPIR
jgi:hypothetical protein